MNGKRAKDIRRKFRQQAERQIANFPKQHMFALQAMPLWERVKYCWKILFKVKKRQMENENGD